MLSPKVSPPIPDTQSERDERRLAIAHVGVRDLRYPFLLQVQGEALRTVGEWSLDVALPAERKGTHMSRFIEWLEALAADSQPLTPESLVPGLERMLSRLQADAGRIDCRFDFFVRKEAPVTGVASLMDYRGGLTAERAAGVTRLWREVRVPVKSLCPCSKEIADYGAHNQRSEVTVRLQTRAGAAPLSWREMLRFAEESASSEIWGLLKRADEKWITEHAYENPRFVEDLVREVALRLNADDRVGAYRVTVENFESIHNHSAFAVIERH